jgi:hypothetical protein
MSVSSLRITTRKYHTLYVHTNSINLIRLAATRNTSTSPLLAPVFTLHSQPLSHFFNNRVITPTPLHTDSISDGSKEVEMWGEKVLEKNSPSEFSDCFLSLKNACGVRCRDGFQQYFWDVPLSLNASPVFEELECTDLS